MRRSGRIWTCAALLLLVSAPAPEAAPALPDRTPTLRRVRVIPTSSLGVERPEGVGFSAANETFFMLDPAGPAGTTRLKTVTARGVRLDATIELAAAHALIAFDARRGRLIALDGATNELLEMPLGTDGLPDPARAVRTRLAGIGPIRAAGLALDGLGNLYIIDRLGGQIVKIAPGADGTPGAGAITRIALGDLAREDLAGLAFDAAARRFHVLTLGPGTVHELTESGARVARHDLAAFGIRDPRALVLAGSGDRTDDPSVQSLYVADAGPRRGAGLVELGFEQRVAPVARLDALRPSSLVRTTDMSLFVPPSPDPSGITYDPVRDLLLIDDGEVEEVRIWANANVFEVSLGGTLLRTWNTTAYAIEPVGIAIDPVTGVVFISDDDAREVFVIDPGLDRLPGTADDVLTHFDTKVFGSDDPEGISYDPVGRRLFIGDGVNAEVYEIRPGPNARFDGIDDVVTHFDVSRLGVSDPETVEFDAVSGNLFIIGSGNDHILEMTTAGTLVSEIDATYLRLDHAAGMTFAPGSANRTLRNLYLVDRGTDNDSDSSENDGALYEITFAPASPPAGGGTGGSDVRIAAGADDAEEKSSGSVLVTDSDLELVTDSGAQTVGLRFNNVAIPRGAQVAKAWIQFKADETRNAACSIRIQGQAVDQAATFTTSSRNISSRPRTTASVPWTPAAWARVGDAGPNQRTPDLSNIIEEIVGRAGWASGNSLAFLFTGTEKRTAESYEGDRTGAALLHFELEAGPALPPVNQPPSVNAGPDLTVVFPNEAVLDGSVSDDGLPVSPGTVTTTWRKIGGPSGAVTFANPGAIDTRASFLGTGSYLLELAASDGALVSRDSVSVTVTASVPVPTTTTIEKRVAAGADDAEQKGTSLSLTSSDLELVDDGGVQTIGMRFTAMTIPRNARIARAWIQFKTDEVGSVATSLWIRGQAADQALAFSSTNLVANRPLTTNSVSWAPAAWTVSNEAGANQRTPDLTSLIQEIVNRSGWASGNALAIIISGTGKRTADAYEGDPAGAPLLHVEYE